MTNTRKLIAVAGGSLALALGASGVALGATTSSHTSAAHAPAAAPASARATWRADLRRIARHTVSAELEVHTASGFVTVEFDKGTVVSFQSGVLTVKRPDGVDSSTTVTGTTKYVGLAESSIAPGDGAAFFEVHGDALVVGSKVLSISSAG